MWGKRPESSDAERAIEPAERAIEPLNGFGDAHRELLQDSSIQFKMEPFQPPRIEAAPDMSGLINMAPFFRFMFWAIVAVAIAFLLYLIISRLTGFTFRRRGKEEAEEPEWHIGEQPA